MRRRGRAKITRPGKDEKRLARGGDRCVVCNWVPSPPTQNQPPGGWPQKSYILSLLRSFPSPVQSVSCPGLFIFSFFSRASYRCVGYVPSFRVGVRIHSRSNTLKTKKGELSFDRFDIRQARCAVFICLLLPVGFPFCGFVSRIEEQARNTSYAGVDCVVSGCISSPRPVTPVLPDHFQPWIMHWFPCLSLPSFCGSLPFPVAARWLVCIDNSLLFFSISLFLSFRRLSPFATPKVGSSLGPSFFSTRQVRPS